MSIAGLFESPYRGAHEPDAERLVYMLLAASNGWASETNLVKFFRRRDKWLWLELESFHVLGSFSHILVREFVDAKFILTIRDCYSWLDSSINHRLWHNQRRLHVNPEEDSGRFWSIMEDIYFRRAEFKHAPEERVLADNGLYTLDGYLSFWADHNRKVLTTVPEDRLLVIRTHEIAQEMGRVAEFLKIPVETLNSAKAHLHKTPRRFGVLSQLDRHFLEQKVDLYCRDLMRKYFPELRSLDDAVVI